MAYGGVDAVVAYTLVGDGAVVRRRRDNMPRYPSR